MEIMENMDSNCISQDNKQLIANMLDLIANDSENSYRTMQYMTDDCIWVMQPGGTEYHGIGEIKAFADTAIKGRSHDDQHKIQILNWFAGSDSLCIEYTHGAKFTGETFTNGTKFDVKTGVLRYCFSYRIRDGRFCEIHEYITSTSWLFNTLLPLFLRRLYRKSKKHFPSNAK